MPNDEKMSVDERRKYLKLVRPRYAKSSLRERGELLTEMGEVTGMHRKSLIRLMNMRSLERAPKKPRLRQRRYGSSVEDAVRIIWESLDYVCAERLIPVLQNTARQLAEWEELALTPELELALGTISRPPSKGCSSAFSRISQSFPGGSLSHLIGYYRTYRWSGYAGVPRTRVVSRLTWCTIAEL